MIRDLNDSDISAVLQTDICIIGSGAAGITLAREFIGTSRQVLLLEAGGSTFEKPSQDPIQSEIVGLNHGGIHIGRARVLGGTTTLWAGQALPLFDIDFRQRDWVAHSGWPISREQLASYYPRAQQVMQLPRVTFDQNSWPNESSTPPDYDPKLIQTYYSQFTHMPNFSQKYRHELAAAPNITVLTHANVTRICANPSANSIQQVLVKSLAQKQCSIKAKTFIVCCGGIESARLLLASDDVEPSGIGNRHDVVGRYFQDHPGVSIRVKTLNQKRFSALYNSFRKDNIRHAIKLASSEALQSSQRILHVGAEVFYPGDDSDPLGSAKLLLQALRRPRQVSGVPGAFVQVGRRPHKILAAIYRRYILKQVASVGNGPPHLGFGVEQMPNPSSRVMLSDQVDCLGMRRTKLDWKVTTEVARSIEVFAQAILREWKRLELAEFDPADLKLNGREHGANGGYIDASHHMGTTRMGSDPRTSVVDSHCRVHGYDNLYIASSSVFPTGGFSNPTLTLLALCLRMADELKMGG